MADQTIAVYQVRAGRIVEPFELSFASLAGEPHSAEQLLRRLLEPHPPSWSRLIVGYSGWGPGQLEAELEASSWLMSDIDRDLIFSTPADRLWEAAIRRLGADPAALQMTGGGIH